MKRQGDLLIIRVKEIPVAAVKLTHRVLAEGETTGHMHELDNGELYEKDDVLYFRISDDRPAILKHPEHGPIAFKPGQYKVIRQREYEPNGWRNVGD
ncbi:MAG: hypothetical protein HQL26_09730 [Candidatus Omnitrophica bacterium]|nr:hypothetical protein [Candidatus Omnitrophota bacterium]